MDVGVSPALEALFGELMGRFMIPCCCICGKSPKKWNDDKWHKLGGLQDFCPEHSDKRLKQYVNEQFEYGDVAERLTQRS